MKAPIETMRICDVAKDDLDIHVNTTKILISLCILDSFKAAGLAIAKA